MEADWIAVASSADIGPRPLPVSIHDVPIVLMRPAPDAPVVAFADRCPHRLVPLSAGVAENGVLRCLYHGWEFGPDGQCVTLPSAGPETNVPPRAHLPAGPEVREADGLVWVRPPRPAADGPMLSNVDLVLRRAWHPVALVDEVGPDGLPVKLIGDEWLVRRDRAEPEPYGLREAWGLLWLAPDEPRAELFPDPDEEDRAYVGAWLPPARTPAPAGFVADNFLDVAHFPFVHSGTFGAGEEKYVPPYEVTLEPDGCRSVQEQWFDNPEDPGVAQGLRPMRQRRRATYVYRAPFQLMLRLEELDAGAVKTILFFVQPETVDSTRIYTKLLLHGIGGIDRPGPDVVAREIAFEEAVLAEDLALQQHTRLTGLPLRFGDELHVRADRMGVALRRILRDFAQQR